MATSVKSVTLNLRGLRSRQKQVQLRRLLHSSLLDFVAAQETMIESEQETEKAQGPFLSNYDVLMTHAVGFSASCFGLLRKALPYSALPYNIDSEGRLIACDFLPHGEPWHLINVYAFNDVAERVDMFESI